MAARTAVPAVVTNQQRQRMRQMLPPQKPWPAAAGTPSAACSWAAVTTPVCRSENGHASPESGGVSHGFDSGICDFVSRY